MNEYKPIYDGDVRVYMKAAFYRGHSKDPREVVKIEDIDTPKPKTNEVLIKVEAASYNHNDLWGIWGEPIKIPMPHISGSDVTGTVVEVGENVTPNIKIGDRKHHHIHIRKAMREVVSWNFPAQIVGFYVNDKRKIEEVK